jgi:hypothetical protein
MGFHYPLTGVQFPDGHWMEEPAGDEAQIQETEL